MNVLERIERGELSLLLTRHVTSGRPYIIDGYVSVEEEAKAELLRLAKLGAAAEKAIKNSGEFVTDGLCVQFYSLNEDDCPGCHWQDFCRLRKDGK